MITKNGICDIALLESETGRNISAIAFLEVDKERGICDTELLKDDKERGIYNIALLEDNKENGLILCGSTGKVITKTVYEPRHEKTCFRGVRPSKSQTGLLSYRSKLES